MLEKSMMLISQKQEVSFSNHSPAEPQQCSEESKKTTSEAMRNEGNEALPGDQQALSGHEAVQLASSPPPAVALDYWDFCEVPGCTPSVPGPRTHGLRDTTVDTKFSSHPQRCP